METPNPYSVCNNISDQFAFKNDLKFADNRMDMSKWINNVCFNRGTRCGEDCIRASNHSGHRRFLIWYWISWEWWM